MPMEPHNGSRTFKAHMVQEAAVHTPTLPYQNREANPKQNETSHETNLKPGLSLL